MSNEFNVARDLRIDESDMNEELARQPGLSAHYNDVYEEALAIAKKKDLQLEVFEAALDGKIRDQYRSRNIKFTEPMVASAMKLNDGWQRLKEESIDLWAKVGQLKGLSRSMFDRKDMLKELGANARSEITGSRNAAQVIPLKSFEQKN